uniref:Uncharacterized protein n=1 Tax=Siphoviridae sp. ctnMR5 TaxID=2825658 RepID=A0A8S5U8Y4_9CAUD|nr:MAG TPA: hypothetical protein [Siphoviridae sp. ctnMR5]
MLIQQWNKKLERWELFGVGKILGREGQSPIVKTMVQNSPKLSFSVLVGVRMKSETEKTYQSVPCAVYRNSNAKKTFDIAETLKRRETILFAGWSRDRVGADKVTGEVRVYKECNCEFILPIRLLASPDVPTNLDYRDAEIFIETDDGTLF